MRTALFVTCLVDQCSPDVGLSTVRLLRHASCEVLFDDEQTCCGQPAFNSGYPSHARELARRVIASFERQEAEALVAPSGSCAAMVHHFPGLFSQEEEWRARAEALASRTFELSQFLVDVRGIDSVPGSYSGRVTWHDACHGLRELGVAQQPRKLLAMVRGAELVEMQGSDACCGFGGTFSVKYPDLSVAIGDHKIAAIERAEVGAVVSGDVSCLMHLRGRLERRGSKVQTLHLAEVLAGGTA